MTRTAVKDTEILGQPIAAGERVFCWFRAANRDSAMFPDGDTVLLERENAEQHLSFSAGQPLARSDAGLEDAQ